MTDSPSPGTDEKLDFEKVLERELLEIDGLRVERKVRAGRPGDTSSDRPTIARAHGRRLVGLAFSGGGIRSATFNLGILQALAQLDLLRHFDYLSTVSGGGYIGGWLTAWIKRRGLAEVCEGLAREHPENPRAYPRAAGDPAAEDAPGDGPADEPAENAPDDGPADEARESAADGEASARPAQRADDASVANPAPSPILFLRSFSNYLTPQKGLFSLDAWMAAATYVRNLILNLSMLVLALALVLLLPRLFFASTYWLLGRDPSWWNSPWLMVAALAALTVVTAVATAIKLEITWTKALKDRPRWRWLTEARGVLSTVIAPLFLISILLVYWIYGGALAPCAGDSRLPCSLLWAGYGGLAFAGFWLLVALLWWGFWVWRARRDRKKLFGEIKGRRDLWVWAAALLAALLSGAAGSWLLVVLVATRREGVLEPLDWLKVATWAPPGVVLSILFAGIYFIGLMGSDQPEEERQWWSRMGGGLALAAVGWWGLFVLAFYAPPFLDLLAREAAPLVGAAGLGWVGATALGVIAGRSPATNDAQSSRWLELAAKITPYVFIIGLLMLLSLAIDRALPRGTEPEIRAPGRQSQPLEGEEPASETPWYDQFADLREDSLEVVAESLEDSPLPVLLAVLVALAGSLLLAWRLDVNEFSMHNFYRDRLTRPYLGASRKRDPNPFTGFDRDDDLRLCRLLHASTEQAAERRPAYDGPYPLINTALNLTSGGQEMAWQERQANSFVFTPLHHGFEPGPAEKEAGVTEAYRVSERLASEQPGISLGTAMTVSGAAVNPNMGYHSAPALAFLLTVFNARLGLWLGNPAHGDGWQRKSPRLALGVLLGELFGRTSGGSKFVNLADGGFFDNSGVYELVRRRCRFILACDVEADPDLEFNGLGNVIRRCRTDFGIEIRFENLEPLARRSDSPFSRWHCAVGKILYHRVDEGAPEGSLVYVKATLTGDEPADLLNYQRKHPEFPHQSTGDQWFDESQFESYRRLGQHIGLVVFGGAGLRPDL